MTVAYRQLEVPRPKRWAKDEYNRLVERGAFDEGGHYYLFRGEIIEMSPMLTAHAQAVTKVTKLLFSLFDARRYDIRVQLPFDVPGDSMPEPDFLVCTVQAGKLTPHPSSADLIIEVSETSLLHDRDKALEYAAARVQEYWIVDLKAQRIEVYRNPAADSTTALGFRYPPPAILTLPDTTSFLVLPNADVKASNLFP